MFKKILLPLILVSLFSCANLDFSVSYRIYNNYSTELKIITTDINGLTTTIRLPKTETLNIYTDYQPSSYTELKGTSEEDFDNRCKLPSEIIVKIEYYSIVVVSETNENTGLLESTETVTFLKSESTETIDPEDETAFEISDDDWTYSRQAVNGAKFQKNYK